MTGRRTVGIGCHGTRYQKRATRTIDSRRRGRSEIGPWQNVPTSEVRLRLRKSLGPEDFRSRSRTSEVKLRQITERHAPPPPSDFAEPIFRVAMSNSVVVGIPLRELSLVPPGEFR